MYFPLGSAEAKDLASLGQTLQDVKDLQLELLSLKMTVREAVADL